MHLLFVSLCLPVLQVLGVALESRAQTCATDPHSTPYNISNTYPATSLYLAASTSKEELDPYSVLMTLITTLPEVCRMPPTDPFPAAQISFHYGNASVTLASGAGACGSLTYDDACTTLQGLAEYLTSSDDFHGNDFQITVAGNVVGSGKVQNLQQKY